MPTDPREAKLPKWVQAELERLRKANDDLAADFEEFADEATPDDADAVANPFDKHPRLAARRGETVRFKMRAGEHVDAVVDAFDGSLVLTGSYAVALRPTSSSVVVVSVPGY